MQTFLLIFNLFFFLSILIIGLVFLKKKSSFKSNKQDFEEKKEELIDSIRNAERIQRAVLPAKDTMDRFLEEYFIFYRPKDIVSGDFYWFEYYNCKLYIAVADCTGHGVPGAMMSLICNNALLRALYDDASETTGELLNNTRAHVIENLSKGKFNVHDGMDISLCCIDFLEYSLEWSGANNPIWIIRSEEFIELKPNKFCVGKDINDEPFVTHNIELAENDLIYMFSDGYKDQFGGPQNKKFLSKRLKEMILEMNNLPMSEQSIVVEENLKNWMGNNIQVDDICVMGIKLV
jgi:serine phosphatase RsbU (regulator of sigma subunit)